MTASIFVGWVVCGLAIAFSAAVLALRPTGEDLRFYIASAAELATGGSPYRAPNPICDDRFGCFPYPPPSLLPYVVLGAVPFGIASTLLAAAYVAVAVAIVGMGVRRLPPHLRPWVAAALAVFFPLVLELSLLNMNLLTVGLALAAWRLRDRPGTSGALLAAAAGAKVLGAPLLGFYVAARRWPHLAWAVVAGVVVALVTAPLIGHLWPDALNAILWRTTTEDVAGIRPLEMKGAVPHLVTALGAAAIIVASGIATRRSPNDASDLHSLALAAIPLLAQLIQYPNLVLLIPLLLALARRLSARPVLLALPALAWLAIQMPIGMEWWRFGGLVATVALGVVFVLFPALSLPVTRWSRDADPMP